MQKFFRPTRYPVLIIFAILLLSACNSNKEEKKDGDEVTIAPPKTNALTAGSLDTLYVERKAFDDLQGNPKLIYSFVFTSPDTLTLHGWIDKSPFDSLPNMKLKYFNRSTTESYGLGTYFGNVILRSVDVVKIKAALTPTMNYVIFSPKLLGNNIKYEILVTDKLRNQKAAILVVSATGADANPSPPKTY